MKITKKKELQILKQNMKVSEAYNVYRKESGKMEAMIQPSATHAVSKNDLDLLQVLLNLTSPIDKKGNYNSCGDYIGRFNLYYAAEIIKGNLKKKKKKA